MLIAPTGRSLESFCGVRPLLDRPAVAPGRRRGGEDTLAGWGWGAGSQPPPPGEEFTGRSTLTEWCGEGEETTELTERDNSVMAWLFCLFLAILAILSFLAILAILGNVEFACRNC